MCPNGDGFFIALQGPDMDPEMPAHPPIQWAYTPDYEIAGIADKNGDEHGFGYYEGRVTTVWDPLILERRFEFYGATGSQLVCHYFDRRGERWVYRFKTTDLAGTKQITLNHLRNITNPLGESTTLEYGDLRNPEATVPTPAPHENWYAPHRQEVTARVNAHPARDILLGAWMCRF